MSKFYKFKAERIIEAKNASEAKDIFADDAFDFASEADCSEYDTFEEAMNS